MAERSGDRIRVGVRGFPLLKNVEDLCGAHTASYSMDSGFSPGPKRPVTLTTHLQLLQTLRMSGAIILLPLFDFMVFTGTTLLPTFHVILPR